MSKKPLALVAAATLAMLALGASPAQADDLHGSAVRADGMNTEPSMRGWLSSSAAPDSWYDPANGLSLLTKDLVKLDDLQIDHLRLEIPWALVERQGKGQYDWSRVDAILRAMRDHAITVQAVLAFTPTWAQSGSKVPETSRYTSDRTGYAWAAVPSVADWTDFVRAAAQRFDARFTGVVDQIEVWNEPDLYYWQGGATRYSDVLLEPAYAAVKAVSPAFQVVMGVSNADTTWLDAVEAAGGLNSFDVLAHHHYGNVAGLTSQHDTIRAWMNASGIGGRPLQLDEYGGSDRVDGSLLTDALTSTALTYSRVQLYNLRDDDDVFYDGSVSHSGGWGLVQHDGVTDKPEYATYKNIVAPASIKTLVNDNTTGVGRNQLTYAGTWNYSATDTEAYRGDTHWTNVANSTYQVTFDGTRVDVYATRGTANGIMAVSIDGGAETTRDTYASFRQDQVLVYSSPTLSSGPHTLRVRVTGSKNGNSTNTYVQADKVRILQQPLALNDNTVGTGTNQFAYTGTWNYSATDTAAYFGDTHWTNSASAVYQVSFDGTGVRLYATKGTANGIMAVSIDGGAETTVDTYASSRQDQVLLYTSPVLSAGVHTVRVRVTGSKNTSATNTYVQADKVVVT